MRSDECLRDVLSELETTLDLARFSNPYFPSDQKSSVLHYFFLIGQRKRSIIVDPNR